MMRTMTLRWITLALLLACGKSGDPDKSARLPERPPLKVEWMGDSLTMRGSADYDRYELVDLKLEREGEPAWVFRGYRFAPGSKLEVGGVAATAPESGKFELRVPAIPTLGAIELESLVKEQADIDPHLEVSITPLGEAAHKTPWKQLQARLDLLALLEAQARAGKGLALAGGDGEAPPTTLMPQRVAAFVGPGKTLADVDRIAVYNAAVDTMVCKDYVGSIYTEPIDIPVQLEQRRFELHDRRSGNVVGTGNATATYKCPKKLTADGIRPGMNIRLPLADIRSWLEKH